VANSILEDLQQITPQANIILIQVMKEAVSISPNNPNFQLNLARSYIFGSRILVQLLSNQEEQNQEVTQKITEYMKAAEKGIRKANELKPGWLPALHYLALINEQQGKIPEAIKTLEEILTLEPSRAETNYELGRLYKDQNRQEEAIELLIRAIQLKPELFEAHLELIDIYESGESFVKAREVVKKALEIFPDNEELLAKQKVLGK